MNSLTRTTVGSRLGRRFVLASAGVLSVALGLIVLAAQAMFISRHDVRLLLWALIPAVLAGGVVALYVARPIADDARRLSDAAQRVASGDLSARTGVRRRDELGEAADRFDLMAERLQAIEHERTLMLSAISHDLRTPLAALRVVIEAMQDGLAHDLPASLATMESQVKALGALVDDLQLHARITSGTLEPELRRVDLTEIVDEAIEVVRPLADPRGVSLNLAATEHVWTEVDPAQFGRVVRNLLDNAVRHAPDHSRVTAEVALVDGLARIRVADDGVGFPVGSEQRVFEPFTRLDPARPPGSGVAGLGLSIARGIVSAHGGEIVVRPGAGGVVEVRLPVASVAEGRVSVPPS